MESKISSILEDIGLEKREIKIYIVLLKEQNLTALEISKRTHIDRTTVYDLLERLMNEGIVSSFVENKVKHFKVLPPEKLLSFYQEKIFSLENIIPSLQEISDQRKESVTCELFHGKNGIRIVINDFIQAKKDYKAIGIRKEYEEFLEFFTDQVILQLDKLKIKETALVEEGSEFIKLKHGSYRQLNKNSLPAVSVLIYGNVTVFFMWKEPYCAIRIENKDFARLQEEYFGLLWETAKP